MSKYETLEVLKGAKAVNIWEVLESRQKDLADFKSKFGREQTIADQKFFSEKLEKLNQHQLMIEELIADLGYRDRPKNYKVTLLISER
jgi:hypothetical protein